MPIQSRGGLAAGESAALPAASAEPAAGESSDPAAGVSPDRRMPRATLLSGNPVGRTNADAQAERRVRSGVCSGSSTRSSVRTLAKRLATSAQLTTFQKELTQLAFTFWYWR